MLILPLAGGIVLVVVLSKSVIYWAICACEVAEINWRLMSREVSCDLCLIFEVYVLVSDNDVVLNMITQCNSLSIKNIHNFTKKIKIINLRWLLLIKKNLRWY